MLFRSPFCLVDQTAGGNEFHINLDPLSRISHLLIRFRNVLGIRKFLSHNPLFFEEAVEAWDRAFIATLHEFHPEYNQTGVRVAPAHVSNKFDFFRSMLVWMGMGASGTVSEGIPGTVIAVLPAVNILAVGFIFSGGIGNTIAVCVVNK